MKQKVKLFKIALCKTDWLLFISLLCVFCSLIDTSSSSAFDNKLRRSMTSPYISTTANVAVDSNRRSLQSFPYTEVIWFCFIGIAAGMYFLYVDT